MLSLMTRRILAVIGTAIVVTFVLGLAKSISTGFAGFWGGLPFVVIAVFVLSLAVYDVWAQCFGKAK